MPVGRVWFDNNDFDNPNAEWPAGDPDAVISPTGWTRAGDCTESNLTWGPAAWYPMNENGVQSMDWADFQLAATFDPRWAI